MLQYNLASVAEPLLGCQGTRPLREEFGRRLGERFYDPAFDAVRPEIGRVIEVAGPRAAVDRYIGYYEPYATDPRPK